MKKTPSDKSNWQQKGGKDYRKIEEKETSTRKSKNSRQRRFLLSA